MEARHSSTTSGGVGSSASGSSSGGGATNLVSSSSGEGESNNSGGGTATATGQPDGESSLNTSLLRIPLQCDNNGNPLAAVGGGGGATGGGVVGESNNNQPPALPEDQDQETYQQTNVTGFHMTDHYEELVLIGSGAYGTVYKARDLNKQGEFVALKKMRIPMTDDGVPVSLIREIGVLKQLETFAHPNVVR